MDRCKLVGCSDAHRKIVRHLARVAKTDVEVLLQGPSGVGKELYARFIHDNSPRNGKSFVPVNCGGLSNDLIKNELFGHVGGAFTGAKEKSPGLVHDAEGGTLFLDEVDSLRMSCQIQLLRFLQDKQYRRLGETRLRQADIRVIAATNTDLEKAVTGGDFRRDLFFRLRVVPISIPPLNLRPADTVELLGEFAAKCSEKYALPKVCFSEDAVRRLKEYEWPGNIRELENCVSYLTCLQLGREITPDDLPLLEDSVIATSTQEHEMMEDESAAVSDIVCKNFQDEKSELIANFERSYLERALDLTSGNISAAARLSGKNRRAFFQLVKKHNINPDEFRVFPP